MMINIETSHTSGDYTTLKPEDTARSADVTNPPAPSRLEPPGRGLAGLLNIAELTQNVARFADYNTVLALSEVSSATRRALHWERQAALTEKKASRIDTIPVFHEALARTNAIPESFHGAALAALGTQISRLPSQQGQAAFDAWVPVAKLSHARSTLLNDLVLASETGRSGLQDAPLLAAQRGANVRAVARRHGITTCEGIRELERRAIFSLNPRSAGSDILSGQDVQTVAHRHSITTAEGISALELRTILDSVPTCAGSAVERGENVQIVARRHGITTPGGIRDLELRAVQSLAPTSAAGAVRKGENIQVVAQGYGITTPESLRDLERRAIRNDAPTSAGGAVKRGQNVLTVAQQYGITTHEGICELERLTIFDNAQSSAGSAVMRGEDFQTVATRHGITTTEGVRDLRAKKERQVPGHARRPARYLH